MFAYDLRVGDSGASQSVGRSHSHLCWVFDDDDDFRAAAVEFLADGLARGCRVRYIAASCTPPTPGRRWPTVSRACGSPRT